MQDAITILSPRNCQVFQRHTREEGPVLLSGRVCVESEAVEGRITGRFISGPFPGEWFPLTFIRASKSFHHPMALPAGGWYRLELRATKEGRIVSEATVETFGVGEVFVGAGQSNSTNCGELKTTQTSGMVSSFSGEDWRLADDPQPGVADKSTGGSFWPAFGDALYQRFHVPIGVATTGFGGTSVNQWQPDTDLFKWCMARIHQLGPGGFRALLWHQGESDWEMSREDYAARLARVIHESKRLAGWEFPWFVAQASYHNAEKPKFDQIRTAQRSLWDDGVALRGPDTDTLTGDHRDIGGAGIHFSPKGLRVHGQLWAGLVGDYVESALDGRTAPIVRQPAGAATFA